MTHVARAALIVGMIVCAGSVARATPLDELIEPEKDRSACFTRVYDAAHLRQHPRQKITSMRIWLRYEQMPGGVEGLALDLGIAVVRQGDTTPLFAQGDCIWDERANVNTSDRRMIMALNKD